MSIIEQDLDMDLVEDVWGEPLHQEPFSWEKVKERTRRIRIAMGLPPDVPPETEEMRQARQARNEAAREFLHTLRQGDPERHEAELAYLMRVLDEDHPSARKLFP